MKLTRNLKSIISKLMVLMMLVCAIGLSVSVDAQAADNTLLNTYGAKYGYSGTCINLYQLRDSSQLNILKQQYNSITLENEMKPDALLGYSPKLIS